MSMNFRSKFEKRIWDNIVRRKLKAEYEPNEPDIRYHLPKRYIPDFVLENGVVVEAKGYLRPSDRAKMLRVKKENPTLDIRFLFQRASQRLTRSKNSLTYGEWADRHGFLWANGDVIPREWWSNND